MSEKRNLINETFQIGHDLIGDLMKDNARLTAALAAANDYRAANAVLDAAMTNMRRQLEDRDAAIVGLREALSETKLYLPAHELGAGIRQRVEAALSQASGSGEDLLRSARREGAEAAAKVADEDAASEVAASERAFHFGRHGVASHRIAGGEVAQRIAARIRALYPGEVGPSHTDTDETNA